MIRKMINLFIVSLVFTVIIGIFPNLSVKAAEVEEATINTIQENLQQTLKDENIIVEDLDITSSNLSLSTSLKDATGDVNKVEVEIVPGKSYITVNSEEVTELGKKESKKYKIDLAHMQLNENSFKGIFTDVDTKQKFSYDTELGTASLIFLIPIGIVMTPAILTALFHTGAMIIVGGAAYVIATQAKKDKKYSHFSATVKSGGVYIGKGLSKSEAVTRLKSNKDTWSISKNQAKGVAASANPTGQPLHEVDKLNGKPKKGYYYHYHPAMRTPKSHAFYGGPVN
ncbi:hypothetical protein BED47_07525 [Gottfriedia luciferensis]|uniref:Uncharacterized protein n=1 Tax=Gottfriedia luciferensis TaxID=178774 RepID=A0ABX2ZS11_9BACI|nr:SAR2788 family putative toxin [Gottfriedia luciferensis]ODG91495.1 hypothetical protein BED47_07525 [Gottfriedia luciferensis]